ncbi:MAG: hypothetical protein Q4D41_04310 [Prevotellaceae bacterium]|nr:hypothetical protein [Prevotellaceae bacterium]
MFNVKTIYIIIFLMSVVFTADAQVRKSKKNVKTQVVDKDEEEPQPEDMIFEDMLPSTAKIMFIDSLVTDKSDYLDHIPLNKESGNVETYDKFWNTPDNPSSYIYVNEFGNKMFFSKTTENGHSELYSADNLGGKWSEAKKVDLGDEFEDVNNPFMMSDGITLYFSAKSKNGLGGYDIYVTMYDADSARFYKPENVGLPYNSKANDYYCIIDEFNSIGWLVTDRNQPNDKVCIYAFEYSDSRVSYNENEVGEENLKNLAAISSIKDTWTDNARLNAAKERLNKLSQRKIDMNDSKISFFVNDNTVYTKIDNFKSATNRTRFNQLVKMKREAETLSDSLDKSRQNYSKATSTAKRQLASQIMNSEKKLEQLNEYIKTLEKEIRNTENLLISKK